MRLIGRYTEDHSSWHWIGLYKETYGEVKQFMFDLYLTQRNMSMIQENWRWGRWLTWNGTDKLDIIHRNREVVREVEASRSISTTISTRWFEIWKKYACTWYSTTIFWVCEEAMNWSFALWSKQENRNVYINANVLNHSIVGCIAARLNVCPESAEAVTVLILTHQNF